MSDKVAETLAALARGERPQCPWCYAEYEGWNDNEGIEAWVWACDSEIRSSAEPCERGENCYEREIAALREENAVLKRQRESVRRLMDAGKALDARLWREALEEGA